MVSGISANSVNLYERINTAKEAMNSKSFYVEFKENPNYLDMEKLRENPMFKDVQSGSLAANLHSGTKEDVIAIARAEGVSSLDEYKSCRNNYPFLSTAELTNEDYQREYKEYMQGRGCSNEEELKALNSTCYATKNDLFSVAEMDIQGSPLAALKYCAGISVSDEQLSSLLSNASIQNIANYVNAGSKNVSDSVLNFQSLLKNICTQDNVDSSLKNSLLSLSNNISDSSEAVNKWSEQVDAYNKAQSGIISQSSKYNAFLISQYQT